MKGSKLMLIKKYDDFLEVRKQLKLSNEDFSRYLGVSYHTRYGWKKNHIILPVYKLLATLLSEKTELVMEATNNPTIKTVEEAIEFYRELVKEYDADKIYRIFGIGNNCVFGWQRRNVIKPIYLILLNCAKIDFDTVKHYDILLFESISKPILESFY